MSELNYIKKFNSQYGRHVGLKTQQYFAPGRVCLLGEHIDYNGGTVLPMAIEQGIHLVMRPSLNDIVWLSSHEQDKELIINLLEPLKYKKEQDWGNYVVAVFKAFQDMGFKVKGAEMMFFSNLPIGAGLSSSAALMLVTGYALNHWLEAGLSKNELAKICQKAENEFIGLNCGLMDHMAVAEGKNGNLIALDCSTNIYRHIPFSSSDYTSVVFYTGKKRSLADSAYNERTKDCATSLKIISRQKRMEDLNWKAINETDLNYIDDVKLKKRAQHVVSEINRVNKGIAALKKHDYESFGQLLFESHTSLKNDYEVSCTELDIFVDFAKTQSNCIGAKMSGAGFGGSAVAIVEKASAHEFAKKAEAYYKDATGLTGISLVSNPSNGVRFI